MGAAPPGGGLVRGKDLSGGSVPIPMEGNPTYPELRCISEELVSAAGSALRKHDGVREDLSPSGAPSSGWHVSVPAMSWRCSAARCQTELSPGRDWPAKRVIRPPLARRGAFGSSRPEKGPTG